MPRRTRQRSTTPIRTISLRGGYLRTYAELKEWVATNATPQSGLSLSSFLIEAADLCRRSSITDPRSADFLSAVLGCTAAEVTTSPKVQIDNTTTTTLDDLFI